MFTKHLLNVQAKKIVKSNKSILRKNFFDQIPFFAISKMAKNQFLNCLKLPEMQFHEKKKIDLFNFTSFFCLDFFKNILARCGARGRSKAKEAAARQKEVVGVVPAFAAAPFSPSAAKKKRRWRETVKVSPLLCIFCHELDGRGALLLCFPLALKLDESQMLFSCHGMPLP